MQSNHSVTGLPVLLIKNMVCRRCILSIEKILGELQVPFTNVIIGEIHLKQHLSAGKRRLLSEKLNEIGLELIDDRLGGLIEKLKACIISKARNEVSDKDRMKNLSVYLSEKLNFEYTYLSHLFSTVEGRTIENYFIEQRIEKAKELIVYGQKTLSEIAFDLDYSSVAHLSNQFKKVSGLTPSHFRKVGAVKRKPLDAI